MFVVAGGLMVILAALWAVEIFMDTDMEPARNFFGPAGFAVAWVGLLGLYPALADRTPWLARTGVLFVVIGIVGTVGGALSAGSQLAGILAARPEWVDLFQLPLLIGIVLGFLTFSVVVLRTGVYSQIVGLLILAPAVMYPAVLVAVGIMGENYPYVLHIVHNSAEALVLLGVGFFLRSTGLPTDRSEPAPEPTTK